jgi:hypothetical protein
MLIDMEEAVPTVCPSVGVAVAANEAAGIAPEVIPLAG